jgi:hypothetical protein
VYGAVRAEQSYRTAQCSRRGGQRKGKEGKEEGRAREGHDVRWVVEFSKESKETKEGCGVRYGGIFKPPVISHFTACSGNKNYPESTIYTGLRSK